MKKIKGQKDLINYSAKIASEFGNVARAILYSQIIYWRDIKQRSEFYKTDKDREKELGLGLSEIKYARKRLNDNGYITTQHKRLHHSTSYVVEESLLNTLLIKLYGEPFYSNEHCQNGPSVESELTIGNDKNNDSESQNGPSVESELTLDIGTEITTEITTESVENTGAPPPPQFDKAQFIQKMRDTEKRGNLYLSKRNQITGRKDFLTEEIKKQLFNFSTLSLEEFKARAEKFEAIKSLILAKKMEKYFFSKIRERDLGKFLEKFNDFGSDDEKIVSLLAMFGEEKKALRILTTPSDTSPTPEPVPELSEQEKIEKKQKLDQAKSQLLSKLTNSNA